MCLHSLLLETLKIWLRNWLTITIKKETPYMPVISEICIVYKFGYCECARKFQGKERKKKLALAIDRNPQGRANYNNPLTDKWTNQPVEKTKGDIKQAESRHDDEKKLGKANAVGCRQPGKCGETVSVSEQKSEHCGACQSYLP